MDSLFLWELGTPKVYLIWLLVLAAQIVVAEINRRVELDVCCVDRGRHRPDALRVDPRDPDGGVVPGSVSTRS